MILTTALAVKSERDSPGTRLGYVKLVDKFDELMYDLSRKTVERKGFL
jgi:hypothetical protein